ncbi:MAG: VCBS repeat-containing protein, partial [Anaerolineales bacterium]|nr:VCBS repeat-containing protein [Anaerolineales bacterium]
MSLPPRLRTLFLSLLVLASLALTLTLISARPLAQLQASSMTAAAGDGSTIAITGQGFNPALLTIAQGSQVTWQNDTSQVQYLRSGQAIFSQFLPAIVKATGTRSGGRGNSVAAPAGSDFAATLQPGETFSFTFNDLGDFPFYLTNNPNITGTITVVESTGGNLVLDPIGDQVALLGQTLNFSVTATYDGNAPLAFSVAPLPLPDNAQFDISAGTFSFTPAFAQVGNHPLTFSVTDGTISAQESITITVPQPEPTDTTGLQGRILDANDAESGIITPLVGATVTNIESGLSATTDGAGFFTLTGLTPGLNHFDFQGSTAIPAGTYGAYRADKTLIANVINVVNRPIFIMAIDIAGQVTVNPAITTTVNNPNIDTTVVIGPHTVMDEQGNEFDGDISISPVPPDFTPGSLPDRLNPEQVITVQPMGLTFAQPAPVTFPNSMGLPPGTETDIWSMDHDLGIFFIAGRGQVSADGQWIETIEGGIREASWHFPLPPEPAAAPPAEATEDTQPIGTNQNGSNCGSFITFYDGCLSVSVGTPDYYSLGQMRRSTLVYNSNWAAPHVQIPFEVTIAQVSAVPDLFAYQTEFAGVISHEPVYLDTSGLNEGQDETIRASVYLDAAHLPTGSYWHNIRATNFFGNASVATDLTGRSLIVNNQSSYFGAGWSLAGLQQLFPQADGRMLITDGSGTAQLFSPESLVNSPALFPQLRNVTTGNGAQDVAIGDMNGDLINDLVVANWIGDNIVVLLGDGLGGYTSAGSHVAGNSPIGLELADLDGDGDLDVAVANNDSDSVYVYLGNGTGALSPALRYPVGDEPSGLVVADMDDDGALDLVVSIYDHDRAVILYGNGDGTFGSFPTFSAGNGPDHVALGDFNGDGLLDMVSADWFGDRISLHLATAPGVFGPRTEYTAGNSPTQLVTADLDNDGDLDVAVANNDDDTVSVFIGNGAGELSLATHYPVGDEPTDIEVADVDVDGALDLVVTIYDHDRAEILYGDGSGAFGSFPIYATGNGPDHVALGDFNEDGLLDMVSANWFGDNISLRLATAPGLFGPRTDYAAGNSPIQLVAADFGGEGDLDVAVVNNDADTISIFQGNGLGSLNRIATYQVGDEPTDIEAVDMDGDGLLDLVITVYDHDRVEILYGKVDG